MLLKRIMAAIIGALAPFIAILTAGLIADLVSII